DRRELEPGAGPSGSYPARKYSRRATWRGKDDIGCGDESRVRPREAPACVDERLQRSAGKRRRATEIADDHVDLRRQLEAHGIDLLKADAVSASVGRRHLRPEVNDRIDVDRMNVRRS